MSANVGEGYNEQILQATIDGEPYVNENPYPSRIEVLLMELKEAIESGGGGVIDTTVNGTSENAVQNKAIYNYVNSSVATNTANFIGTFNSVDALEAYSGTVTNNDYAFVVGTDSDGNTVYNRYKYNGETETWSFEYALNNSSFTAAQWAAINSGIDSAKVVQYDKDSTALIQQVDGGAKNLFDYAKSYSLSNITNNDGVYTTASDTLTTLRLQIAKSLNGTIVENLVQESIYNTGVYYWEFTKYSSFNAFRIGHNGSAYNAWFSYSLENLTNGQKYVIRIDITRCSDSGGSFQWRDIMICTAEDWAISQKFAAYAPTNRELYEMIQALQA